MLSVTQKKKPKINTVTMTTVVVDCTSFRAGVTTFFNSARTSLRKCVKFPHVLSALPERLERAPGSCRLAELSSPFLIADSVAILPILRSRRHAASIPTNLAGAEGFEPPSPVLETGSLTVELTPLKTALSAQSPVPGDAGAGAGYFTSLCGVLLRHRLQNFFFSMRSG